MANAVVAWDQRPDYLAYTDWTPIPGITSYAVPRKGTYTDVTQFHPGQAFLSEQNLPDIIYQLNPCEEWKRFKKSPLPKPKRNPDDSLVYEHYTRPGQERQPLLDFKILPDKISTEEGWWYHEFVRRMDPRIRLRDIIMREEATADRLRMSDQRYMNLHLNSPSCKTYRPAWRMLSWHTKPRLDGQNQVKQLVLRSLTEAQKSANTTRGSTPGLINPALGDVHGNRVEIPALVSRKRGPKRAAVNANNNPAPQPRSPQAQQIHQGTLVQQAPLPQDTRAPSSVVSAASDAPSQKSASTATAPGHKDTRGYFNVQARDAAAMPPPPRPLRLRINRSLPSQGIDSYPEPPYSSNRPPKFVGTQARSEEEEDFTGASRHVLTPVCQVMSEEEMATMSARSDAAMAEIIWMCEPFLDPNSNFQGPPPMDLSAELIDELGIGLLFPYQAAGKGRERGTEEAMPSKARTMEARDVAQQQRPMLSQKQGKKQKGYYEGTEDRQHNGNFQQVQLDMKRQKIRPVKRVKSAHNAYSQNKMSDQDAASNFHQQPRFNIQLGHYQSGYGHGQSFGRPALQGTRPQQTSVKDVDDGLAYEEPNGAMCRSSRTTIPEFQAPREPVAPPYLPVPTIGEEMLHDSISFADPRASADGLSHGDIQTGQALVYQPFKWSSIPHSHYVSHQAGMAHPSSTVNDDHPRHPRRHTSNDHGYRHYATSGMGIAQSIEAAQMQQLGGGYPFQPAGTPAARVDSFHVPDVTAESSVHTLPSDGVLDIPLDPLFEAYLNETFS